MKRFSKTHLWHQLLVTVVAIQSPFVTLLEGDEHELPELLEDTLAFYCYDCHGGGITEGGLDLEETPFKLSDPHNREKWIHVFDRIQSGEMPPKEEEQIENEEREAFLAALQPQLLNAENKDIRNKGRARGRRLTRVEYENSIHDLLGIRIPLISLLPSDETDGSFQTIAQGQQLSHFHLSKYLEAADKALTEAIKRSKNDGSSFEQYFSPHSIAGSVPRYYENYRGPQKKGKRIYAWARAIGFNGSMQPTRVPESGWYRIRLENVEGINVNDNGVVWGTLKTGAGTSAQAHLELATLIEATTQPKDIVCETWIEEEDLLVIEPNRGGQPKVRRKGPRPENPRQRRVYYHDRDLIAEGYEAIAFDSIEIKRIYPGGTQSQVREKLFPGVVFKENEPQLIDPQQEIESLITLFAEKAFRRPVTAQQIRPYQQLAVKRYLESKDPFQALHEGYRAILCSPRFLTFVEPVGKLDDHAIATRLSYLLWSSTPDQTLRKLADNKILSRPKVLKKEISRLWQHPRSQNFVENFTDQWLRLAEIDFTTPDPRRFYKFDTVLQESMLLETRAFFRELIQEDLPINHLIDSDFAMLNTRLQRHYHQEHLKVKPGKGIQKVKVAPEDRSGLVTQASILKVTADGSVTSPILRGVWIGERILGLHIPPPPANVPAIEPDIRGAVSIRDQLEKHRADPSCAACHTKIDPQGFALESFDPIGGLREYYGRKNDSVKVDPSGQTLDGLSFPDIEGWKAIYSQRPRLIAKAFVKQLLAYGTGAEIGFSDRRAIERILDKAKDQNYGVRSLIEAAISSDIFLTK